MSQNTHTSATTTATTTEALYWVLGYGYDCDGFNRGEVESFATQSSACSRADDMNEWSDGIEYRVTGDIRELQRYCEDFDKDWKNYLHVI